MDIEETHLHCPNWTDANEEILTGPFNYLYHHPGKDFRKFMVESFNKILKVSTNDLHKIEQVIDILHCSSLLIDDVEDDALLRRGIPAAHTVYGVPITINSSNYMYFKAFEILKTLANLESFTVFNEEMLNLHRGQGLDLYWRETLTCPTEPEYCEMVMNKTGGLFRLAIRLMLSNSSIAKAYPIASSLLIKLINLFGIIYQIKDDYLNLQSDNYENNKGFCEDISEGKFSFIIIHAIRFNLNNKEVISILKQKTKDKSLKIYMLNYMQNVSNSFKYCEQTLSILTKKAESLINQIEIEFQITDRSITSDLYLILKKLASI
ncbi:farnesyltranstransferase [Ascoidea rubescens DSM 1968]|uniref:Geranylgeranyl diphosphate synthase n=1 Tax=Ascoidea rubescens DSM 1968 TaxID=1344418 RepID=A0A1D2VEE4_9ASCO|nr:geranylgeranyl diphosphate synthase [Ascoidea rubescens DSM 1968]ODV60006.1 geranylgeranyl diphosphate synthase [Ascoidea rubescens DSM 1968]